MSIDTTDSHLSSDYAQALLLHIATWQNVTTIIVHGGSVFEFKGVFPAGTMAEGYYNLSGDSGFEGHLKLSAIKHIELQAKTHRGRDSYAFVFVDANNDVIFKIFLGRDAQGNVHPQQLDAFMTIQQEKRVL